MRAGVLVFCVVLLSARSARAEKSVAEQSTIELLDAMGAADVAGRYPAYQELLTRKDAGLVVPLLARIEGYDLSAQSYGVSLLQQLTGESVTKAMEKLLDARPPYLRACAAMHLHPQQPARASKVLVEALGQAKSDPGALQMVLGRLGGLRDAAVHAAVRAFVTAESSTEVLGSALTHLGYADDTEVLPQVRELLKAAPVDTRALAAAFLLKQGEEDHAGVLVQAFDDDAFTYSAFVRLRTWMEQAVRIPEPVLAAVVRRVESETLAHFVSYMIALLAQAEHAPAVPAMRRLLASKDAVIGKAAFEALSTLPNGLDKDALAAELDSPDATRRLGAADALRRRDDRTGLAAVLELAKAGSAQRREAVRVLGGFRVEAAVEPLIDALTDEDVSTRSYAQSGLMGVLSTLYPYRRLDLTSTGFTTQADVAVRAKAAEQLRQWWKANREKRW